MKWIISWNSFIQNMMNIFWMWNSICFKLDWWSPFLQNCIQCLLCYFIKMEEQMLQSQILCHTFLCLSLPRPLYNWIIETRDMSKELALFCVYFLTVRLYIQLGQFIIIQFTLPKPYYQVPSSVKLVFKILHLHLLNILTLLTLRVVIGYHHTRLTTILTVFDYKCSGSIFTGTKILLSQLSVDFQNNLSLNLFISVLVMFLSLD